MEIYPRSRSSRYVIDDDIIPKVTVDGEPHEIMTLIAAISGIIAAFIILAILMTYIGCNNKPERSLQKQLSSSSTSSALTTISTIENIENGDVRTENIHNNYPLVLNLNNFNGERKRITMKYIEIPQILNCRALELHGEFNKAFTYEYDKDKNNSLIRIDRMTNNKIPIPFIIVEKF